MSKFVESEKPQANQVQWQFRPEVRAAQKAIELYCLNAPDRESAVEALTYLCIELDEERQALRAQRLILDPNCDPETCSLTCRICDGVNREAREAKLRQITESAEVDAAYTDLFPYTETLESIFRWETGDPVARLGYTTRALFQVRTSLLSPNRVKLITK